MLFVEAVILSMARAVDRLIAPIQARSPAPTISVFDWLSLLSFIELKVKSLKVESIKQKGER